MNNHECPKTKAAVINGQYITGCGHCLNNVQHSSDYAARFKREAMKKDYRKDIVQRYEGDKVNPEWVKLYEDKAREAFGDAEVERILRGV